MIDNKLVLNECDRAVDSLFFVTAKGFVRRMIDGIDGANLNESVIQYSCYGYELQNWIYHKNVRQFGKFIHNSSFICQFRCHLIFKTDAENSERSENEFMPWSGTKNRGDGTRM